MLYELWTMQIYGCILGLWYDIGLDWIACNARYSY
jgi:hypothetical protein